MWFEDSKHANDFAVQQFSVFPYLTREYRIVWQKVNFDIFDYYKNSNADELYCLYLYLPFPDICFDLFMCDDNS